MSKTPTCPETIGKSGNAVKSSTAYREYGCRCDTCTTWKAGGKPNYAIQKQFEPTALTKARDEAIAEVGEGTVYDMIAGGLTHREIAECLGLDGKDKNVRSAIYQWLTRTDPERYDEAKRESTGALADKAGEVFGDEAPVTSADAKWRNDRSGYFRWLAELRDPRPAGGIEVSIGELHLQALIQAGSADAVRRNREAHGIENAEWDFVPSDNEGEA